MKRIGHLYEQICLPYNIELADNKARRNKKVKWGIKKHDKNKIKENKLLLESFKNLTYKTSQYTTFTIHEPKERLIFRLPYYPDRIAHHAIMNVMEDIWTKVFIKNTYSCIKGRGIHNLVKDLKKVLTQDKENTKYCLKIDIHKFYPSINHDILLDIIKKKVKDNKLLTILEEIIRSASGVPIGNYLSLYFANLYLAYFDHWIKEELKCKYYFRYADDIVILSNSKVKLRNICLAIKTYLHCKLKLDLKPNYQVFPVDKRGIDYVGYCFYHTHIKLRKSIKVKIFKLINKYKRKEIGFTKMYLRMLAYFGWLKHCNSKKLLLKIYKLTNLKFSNWFGSKTNIIKFKNKHVYAVNFKRYSKYFKINYTYKKKAYTVKSVNNKLFSLLKNIKLPNLIKL